jgi:hypothetical protein
VPATETTPEIPGKGLYIQRYLFPNVPEIPPLGVRTVYDQRDLENRFNDFSLRSDDPVSFEVGGTLLDNLHTTLLREGADEATSKKTVKFAQDCRRPFDEFDKCDTFSIPVGQQVSRFREDADFWSASGENPFGTVKVSYRNVCVEIAFPSPLDRQICLDLGIDVGGEEFIDFAEDADVQYPTDFPALPPF